MSSKITKITDEKPSGIQCPNCQTSIPAETTGYDDLLRQARGIELEKAIRIEIVKLKKLAEINEKNIRLEEKEKSADKDRVIAEQKGTIAGFEPLKSSAVEAAVAKNTALLNKTHAQENKQRITELVEAKANLSASDKTMASAVALAKSQALSEGKEILRTALTPKLDKAEKAVREERDERIKLSGEYKNYQTTSENKIEKLTEDNLVLRQNITTRHPKLNGEDMEQGVYEILTDLCDKAYPLATLNKDTQGKTRGDFILRDFLEAGDSSPFFSVMIEVKNEAPDTKTKKKIESFFAKLDKDREKKSCAIALLVTNHEAGNLAYEKGFRDVSRDYPNMYVVRPDYVDAIIPFLRGQAIELALLQHKVDELKAQDKDFSKALDAHDRLKREILSGLEDHILKAEKMRKKMTLSSERAFEAGTLADDLIHDLRDAEACVQNSKITTLKNSQRKVSRKFASVKK